MALSATYLPAAFLCWVAGLMCVHAEDAKVAPAEWSGQRIAELARQLKDDAYGSREQASHKLARAPVTVMPILEQLAREADDPESRQRLHEAARTLFMKWIVRQLPEWNKGRGFLGIAWEVRPNKEGVSLTNVFPDTAAERAGLKANDVILAVNGQRFEKGVTHEDVQPIWRRMIPDDRLELVVKRADQAEPLKLVAVVGRKEEGDGGFTSGTPSDWEKAGNLWARYREGRLQQAQVQESKIQVPDAIAHRKLQSWPTVLQSTRSGLNQDAR